MYFFLKNFLRICIKRYTCYIFKMKKIFNILEILTNLLNILS